MLFNSWDFILFFVLVYFLYWSAFRNHLKVQNSLLLVAGYVFYSFWNWRFLALLIASTVIDYGFGKLIFKVEKRRRRLFLWISIANNLGILAFFKYYNFFAGSAVDFLSLFHLSVDPWLLNIVLPVGISFYTFHGMSYVLDIYYGRIEPAKDFTNYAVFVSFFPLLVAGPIERAARLLPQIEKKRTFSHQQSVEGLRLILWGYFLKVVIADSLAKCVNLIFGHYQRYNGTTLALGAVYFAIQIYGDFCGYTNIARGVAKLLGFELAANFKYPYFSRDIAEFWRRWHVSLSSWFRDYLYIPLGGSRVRLALAIRNLFIVFLVSGFWHGASWNFVVWGGIHALLFFPLVVLQRHRRYTADVVAAGAKLPGAWEVFQMTATFAVVCFAWIFFRSPSLSFAMDYIWRLGTNIVGVPAFTTYLPYAILPLLMDWQYRRGDQSVLFHKNRYLRWGLYFVLGFSVMLYSSDGANSFIYFQF